MEAKTGYKLKQLIADENVKLIFALVDMDDPRPYTKLEQHLPNATSEDLSAIAKVNEFITDCFTHDWKPSVGFMTEFRRPLAQVLIISNTYGGFTNSRYYPADPVHNLFDLL
jgi:hypothetical protein